MVSSIVYGPVPSRRLGRSLGINNIPPKICSYSCVYCQLGKTLRMEVEPRPFYKTARIAEQARAKLKQAREKVDYVTFVPDGEPTLDADLGEEIGVLKGQGVRVAVITNGSLLWREDIRQNLLKADWLSLKVDAVSEDTWRKVDRPHKLLKFLAVLKPVKVYIAIPTRPPAEHVEPATEQTINAAYQVFKEKLDDVEYLIGYEGNAFARTGRVQDDLLSITSVHPMREDAVAEFLSNARTDWGTVQELIDNGSLMDLEYQGKKFYMRKLPGTFF